MKGVSVVLHLEYTSFKNAVSCENFLLLKRSSTTLQTTGLDFLSHLRIAVFSSAVAMPIDER